MDLDGLYNDLRAYNGQAVTLRLDVLTLECTFVNVKQGGSEGHDQLELNLQFDNLTDGDYREMQRHLGQAVDFRLGALTGRIQLDACSTLPSGPQFADESQHPFTLTISTPAETTEVAESAKEPEMPESPARVEALLQDLRTAGFHSLADQVQDIDTRVRRPGRVQLTAAVSRLRVLHHYAMAERLETIGQELYGALRALPDLRPTMRQALRGTTLEACGEARLRAALDAFQEALEDDEEEVDAMGPGAPAMSVRAPMTMLIPNKTPFPSKDST